MVKLLCAALLLTACYQPELRDCTIACERADDCANGQVCGSDGWCAAPEAAGTCATRPDGAVPDAALPPDAAAHATLHIVVQGKGKIVVDPLEASCVGGDADHPGDCTYDVAPGSVEMLLPVVMHDHTVFGGWTTDNCASSTDTCVVTVDAPTTLVGATFVADH